MLDAPDIAVDREVQDRLQALADFLRTQKVKVDERARPAIDPREAFRVYTQLLRAATSDRQTDADFEKNAAISRAPCRPATRATARGRRGRPSCPTATGSPSARRAIACGVQWAEFFTRYDLLLCPVASTAAFPHDQKGERYDRTLAVNGRRVPVTDHLFWAGLHRRVLPARRPPRRAASRRAGCRWACRSWRRSTAI